LAQKVTLGVVAGASLSDDYRNSSFTFAEGTTRYAANASQWFMIGPTLDFALNDKISVEVDAIHRRVRSTQLTVLGTPLELPDNVTIRQIGPFVNDASTWQISTFGKFRFPDTQMKPFVEFGPSFVPIENRDLTGINAGAGVELSAGRVKLTPTVRYTRWLNNQDLGAEPNQLQFLIGVHENSNSWRPTVFGRPLSLGFVIGNGVTKVLKDHSDPEFLVASTSDPHTPIAGVRLGFPVSDHAAIEVDGLYRATHQIDAIIQPDGSIRKTSSRSAFLVWQFPMLAKYRFPVSKVAPLFEFGPSVRMTAHTHSEDYSHYGVTAGLGVSGRFGNMNVSPAIRYTRWASDRKRLGRESATATSPDQVEVLVGFSF